MPVELYWFEDREPEEEYDREALRDYWLDERADAYLDYEWEDGRDDSSDS